MNILQIISNLDADDNVKDVLSSTRFLTLNGHKAVVASDGGKGLKEIDDIGARHYMVAIGRNVFLMPFLILRLSQIILKENIQIVHAKDALSSFLAFFVSRITGRVFISSIYTEEAAGFFKKTQFWAKRIVFFSENQARNIREKYSIPHDKICIIPPAIDIKTVPAVHPGDHFVIGATLSGASLEGKQNFIKSISILARTIYKLKVFIIEKAPLYRKGHEEELKLLVRRHALDSIVTFLLESEYIKPMSKIDLFVEVNENQTVPSRILLEAQALGIPAIAVGARQAENPKDLALKIVDLEKNKDLRKEMGEARKKFVSENFNIKKIMESTLKLYENALSSTNILIIKIGALGDIILASPSVRAIRQKLPNAKIKLLVGIDNKDVFINCPFIDEIIVCDFKGRDRGIKGLLHIAKRLRREHFDVVLDLQNNKKSHILSFLSCAPNRFGYDNGKLSILLNKKIKDTGLSLDPIEHQAKVLSLLGIRDIDKSLELWPTEEDEKWAEGFLQSHWVKAKARLIAINVGSSPRWFTKLWPVEYFTEVSDKLAKNFGVRVMLIGSRKDLRAEEFLKRTKCKPIDALGKTSIPRLASLIKRSNLLLSSDSAPIHVAASVHIPFVALFGPTDPLKHLPPVKEKNVIKKDFPCMPCYHTHCDRGYVCMRSIKPDEVYEAILRLLDIK